MALLRSALPRRPSPPRSGDRLSTLSTVGIAALRTGFGAAMLARPALLGRSLAVEPSTAVRTGWLTQMVGVRELVLGLGTLDARRRRSDVRPWLLAQALADAGDAAAIAAAVRRRHVGAARGSAVVGFAVAGVWGDLVAVRGLSRR